MVEVTVGAFRSFNLNGTGSEKALHTQNILSTFFVISTSKFLAFKCVVGCSSTCEVVDRSQSKKYMVVRNGSLSVRVDVDDKKK